MIKKILIIIVLTINVIPYTVFANDGGDRLDDKNFLGIEVKPQSLIAEIDGDIRLHVTLQNNTNCPILIKSINSVFKYNYLGIDVNNLDAFDEFIMPGKKVYFEITTKVPQSIDWYVLDEKYYADTYFSMDYEMAWWEPSDGYVFTRENYYDEDIYWYTYNAPLEPIPIEITNLYDGSDFCAIKLVEKENNILFCNVDDGKDNSYRGEYYASLSNDIVIKNTSMKQLSKVLINTKVPSDDRDIEEINLQSDEELTYETTNYYYMIPEKISETLPAAYQVTFLADGKHYGVYIEKEYHTNILTPPNVTFEIVPEANIDAEEVNCILKITNNSEEDYFNFYYKLKEEFQEIIPILKSGEVIKIPCNLISDNYHYFYKGLLIADYVYLWDSDGYKIEDAEIKFYSNSSKESLYDLIPTLTTTNEPTPVVTSYPTPTLDITPIPSNEIQVVKTDEKSAIPPWTYIILAISAIFVAIIIFLLRNKSEEKDKT